MVRIRSAISLAALLVKVTARMREGGIPRTAMRAATPAVRVRVLPVPAPARTSTAPSSIAAPAWVGVSPARIAPIQSAGTDEEAGSMAGSYGSLNLDMTPPTRYADQLLIGRENSELAVEHPFALFVALAVDNHALDVLLGDVVGFDKDEGISQRVAGHRPHAAALLGNGQSGEGRS